MKKIIIILILLLFPISFIHAEELPGNAISSVIMEYSTGKILYENNANQRLAPASMTKIMTMLLTMEAIDEGKISMDDNITISKVAADMGGSQMFLEANSTIKLKELIKGVAIASANDAAVALAETVGGSLDNFVDMMNEKVKELGLTNTTFKNPHGLDEEEHLSTAHDMAVMARELIKYKDILNYTATYEDYFNKPDGSRTWLVNTNKLVRFYKGVDGLKTGYTEGAGYCLTATAQKNGIRFITVVMGEPSSDQRSYDTSNMLNYAFNTYRLNTILSKDNELGKIKVEKGDIEEGTLILNDDITEVEKISDDKKEYSYNIKVDKIVAPVNNKDKVGTIEIIDNEGLIVKEVDITIKENINKANIMQIIKKNIKTFVSGK